MYQNVQRYKRNKQTRQYINKVFLAFLILVRIRISRFLIKKSNTKFTKYGDFSGNILIEMIKSVDSTVKLAQKYR